MDALLGEPVAPETFRLETGLSGHDATRLSAALAMQAHAIRLVDGTLHFDEAALGRLVASWIERLMRYNRSIHRAARREGRPLERYKPFDGVNLLVAVIRGLQAGDPAAVAHEVVWRQPFPNANHRTALAALLDELAIESEGIPELANPVFEESKRLLDGADQSLSNAEAKGRHLFAWEELARRLQSMR